MPIWCSVYLPGKPLDSPRNWWTIIARHMPHLFAAQICVLGDYELCGGKSSCSPLKIVIMRSILPFVLSILLFQFSDGQYIIITLKM